MKLIFLVLLLIAASQAAPRLDKILRLKPALFRNDRIDRSRYAERRYFDYDDVFGEVGPQPQESPQREYTAGEKGSYYNPSNVEGLNGNYRGRRPGKYYGRFGGLPTDDVIISPSGEVIRNFSKSPTSRYDYY